MSRFSEVTIGALEPYVGRMAADTCIRATALSVGKMSDELSNEDMPALQANVKRLLAPVAGAAVIERIFEEMRGALR